MLDVKDIQHILDLSYPTALGLAQKHGTMSGGKWLLTEEFVDRQIDEKARQVEKMRQRLELKKAIKIMPGEDSF